MTSKSLQGTSVAKTPEASKTGWLYRGCPEPVGSRNLWVARFSYAAVRVQGPLCGLIGVGALLAGGRNLGAAFLVWAFLALLHLAALRKGTPSWRPASGE